MPADVALPVYHPHRPTAREVACRLLGERHQAHTVVEQRQRKPTGAYITCSCGAQATVVLAADLLSIARVPGPTS